MPLAGTQTAALNILNCYDVFKSYDKNNNIVF